MELVFATHNINKVKEIRQGIPPHLQLKTLDEIGCYDEIPETSPTLEGNAILKASYILNNYGLACFADDTGLEVTALNGAPGVFSARYAGEPKNEAENIRKLLREMEGKMDRSARFTTVIALCDGKGTKIFTGEVKGEITLFPRGNMGFGYDPVFQPEGMEKTFAELTLKEKNEISHRARAFAKLLHYLEHHFH